MQRVLEPEGNAQLYLEHAKQFGPEDVKGRLDFLLEVQPSFNKHQSVLEVACGTGVLSYALAQAFPLMRVHGIDTCPEAYAYAKSTYGSLKNLEFRCEDGYAIASNDECYDCTLSWSSLHHFADPHQAIQEMIRVTKKQGSIFIVDLARDTSSDTITRIEQYAKSKPEFVTMADSLRASLTAIELMMIVSNLSITQFQVRKRERTVEKYDLKYYDVWCQITK